MLRLSPQKKKHAKNITPYASILGLNANWPNVKSPEFKVLDEVDLRCIVNDKYISTANRQFISLSISVLALHHSPHSFPTRRSSDLVISIYRLQIANSSASRSPFLLFTTLHTLARRSEEHMSELQSPC